MGPGFSLSRGNPSSALYTEPEALNPAPKLFRTGVRVSGVAYGWEVGILGLGLRAWNIANMKGFRV